MLRLPRGSRFRTTHHTERDKRAKSQRDDCWSSVTNVTPLWMRSNRMSLTETPDNVRYEVVMFAVMGSGRPRKGAERLMVSSVKSDPRSQPA